MSQTLASSPAARQVHPLWPPPQNEEDCLNSDRLFVAMTAAYRPSGGMARSDALERRLSERAGGDGQGLAQLLVSGELFSFAWNQRCWVPMFQFEPVSLSRKAGSRQVLGELGAVYDGWSLALWFSQPNAWLNHHRPVDQLDSNLAQVLEAARADRFIAAG